MRMPRFRIRTLMIAVAVAALPLAGIVAYQRFWEPRVEVIDRGDGRFTILHSRVTVTHVGVAPVVLAIAVAFVVLGWAWRRRK